MYAPHESPTTSTRSEPVKKRRKVEVAAATLTAGTAVSKRCVFVEMFAGTGQLSKAVRRVMETVLDDPIYSRWYGLPGLACADRPES